MFEVRGWKVSAPLKADTSTVTRALPEEHATDGAQANGSPATGPKAKKRKRGGRGRGDGVEVTSENLAEVWQQYIEGVSVKKQKLIGQPTKQNGGQDKTVTKDSKRHGKSEKATGAAQGHKSQERQDETPKKPKSNDATAATKAPSVTTTTTPTKLTPMQSKMSQKLTGARFRHLNEQLYTTPSAASRDLFAANPDMFAEYHRGFEQQVVSWPENPVDGFVTDILRRGKVRADRRGGPGGKPDKRSRQRQDDGPEAVGGPTPLPRSAEPPHTCRVADLGCGTAPLASALQPHLARLRLRVQSFDLHAPNSLVTVADVANLPVVDGGVDVAIACLALMGTNWLDFVEEAWRVLRWRGQLWVAEIKSRFAREGDATATPSAGGKQGLSKRQMKKKGLVGKEATKRDRAKEEKENGERLAVEVDGVEEAGGKGGTDVTPFVQALERRGFVLEGEPDLSNRMFVKMRFIKSGTPSIGKHAKSGQKGGAKKFVEQSDESDLQEDRILKPCVYKIR